MNSITILQIAIIAIIGFWLGFSGVGLLGGILILIFVIIYGAFCYVQGRVAGEDIPTKKPLSVP